MSGKFIFNREYTVLIKYNLASPTSAIIMWLRSANLIDTSDPWRVIFSGSVSHYFAGNVYNSCPACIIQRSGGTAETTIPLPTTIYGGYLDAVTGQLVATHDENGNLLTNQKLYFLPPVNIDALAGTNNVWSDAGDVTVSYRVEP